MKMRTPKSIFLIFAAILLITSGQEAMGRGEDIDSSSPLAQGLDSFRRDLVSVVGCGCGCDMTLSICQRDMPDCTTRPEMMKKIEESLKTGKPNLLSVAGCPCGCDMTLTVCEREMSTCATRPEIIEEIKLLAVKHKIEEKILKNLGVSMSPVERAIAAAAEDKYVFLYFDKKGSRDSKKMARVIEKAKKRWAARASFVNIDIDAPQEREIINRFRIRKVPLTLVIAPNGAITAGFPGVVDLEVLERGFVSPKMTEVLKAIQKEKTIFLCVLNSQTSYSEEVLKAANEATRMLGGIAELIEIDPKDKREELLLSQLRVSPDADTSTTFVIAPTGIIVDKFAGRITKRDLFDSFQKILAMKSGCGSPTVTGGSACQPTRGVAGKSTCR